MSTGVNNALVVHSVARVALGCLGVLIDGLAPVALTEGLVATGLGLLGLVVIPVCFLIALLLEFLRTQVHGGAAKTRGEGMSQDVRCSAQ